MTSLAQPHSERPLAMRRIRGDAIPLPHPMPWRRQRALLAERSAMALAQQTSYVAPVLRIGGLAIDLDAVFVFGITVAMLFISTLATKSAATIAALTPLYLFVRRRDLVASFTQRAFLFAFPALALCSVAWSTAPAESLKYAVELLVTITAGVLFASAADKRAVVRAVALAFAVYVGEAMATGGQVRIGIGGGFAFSGLTESKNLMADIAGTGLLITLGAIAIEIGGRRWIAAAGFTLAALLEASALMAARSAGAMVAVAVACAALGGLLLLTQVGRAARAWIASMVLLLVVIAGLNYRAFAQALIGFAANVFDKDPTLTGRTYLWYRAQDVMQEAPLLGRGYSAFWLQGNTDAEGLWRYAGLVGRGGFNFHNTAIDLRVTLGWLGVGVFFGVVALGMFFLVRRFVMRPTLPVVCWTSVALYEISRMAIESICYQQFYHPTLLLFAALGMGVGAWERVAPPAPHRYAAPRFIPVDYASGAASWGGLARR
jgi:exopolysaccharide production protein ExoQ